MRPEQSCNNALQGREAPRGQRVQHAVRGDQWVCERLPVIEELRGVQWASGWLRTGLDGSRVASDAARKASRRRLMQTRLRIR